MTVRTVAMLTAGGLAPCLSSAVGGLIQRYTELAPDVRIIAYRNGYAGLPSRFSIRDPALPF
jgi:pyrophosphate--fructose-6-phosphate 1-phosphotransferase